MTNENYFCEKKKQISNYETFIANNYKKRLLETDLKRNDITN